MESYKRRLLDKKIDKKIKSIGGKVYHYRDSSGLEIDANFVGAFIYLRNTVQTE